MAARFCDSFDAYATADILLRWTSTQIWAGSVAISAGTGRNGTASLQPGGQNALTKTIDAQQTWVVGLAFKIASAPVTRSPIITVQDAGSPQVDVRLNPDGTITATRNGTVLGTSTNVLTFGVWTYLEFKALISSTVGTVDVHVNGTSWISLTAQNTQATSNATANQIKIGIDSNSLGSFGAWNVDDLYILDGTGAGNNTFLGDGRAQALNSKGAGHSTQFTLGAGTSNWQAVSETTEDGDTTYVDSATAGQIDAYTFGSLTPVSGTIPFIQTMIVARKDDAGTRTVADVISDGTTDHVGTSNNVGTSYQQFLTIHETDPVTSAAFTLANVNARQYGVKEVA